jgi:hypothetical protein
MECCCEPGCHEPATIRDRCFRHYKKALRNGEIQTVFRPRAAHCQVTWEEADGTATQCQEPVVAKDLCNVHYKHWQTYGDPLKGTFQHGDCGSLTYRSWCHMIQRCTDPTHPSWADYGGRTNEDGTPNPIRVDPAWKDYRAFKAYLIASDIGLRENVAQARGEGVSIDRWPDLRGDYVPGNVCWSTKQEQTEHRTNTVWVTIEGETQTATAWANSVGMQPSTFLRRLKAGWDPKRALGISDGTKRYVAAVPADTVVDRKAFPRLYFAAGETFVAHCGHWHLTRDFARLCMERLIRIDPETWTEDAVVIEIEI